MKKIKKRVLKKYNLGGFIDDAGELLGNYGRGLADASLSTMGLGNVIQDSAYKGEGADLARGAANVTGKITGTALPIVANMLAPGSGAAISGAQKAIGSFNPAQEQVPQLTPQPVQASSALPGIPTRSFAYGGKVPRNIANAEVENKETMRDPSGVTDKFSGNTHANGGIPVLLAPGTDIFSKKLKSKNGNSFADESLKYSTDKFKKVIDDPKADKLAKSTAAIMFKRNNDKLTQIFNEQESLKAAKFQKAVEKAKMKYGGTVPKYWLGGKTGVEGVTEGFTDEFLRGNGDVNAAPTINMLNQEQPLMSSITPVTPINEAGARPEGFDWKNAALGAAALAPSIYNLGRAAFDKPVQYNASNYQVGTRLPYRDVNFNPIEQGIKQQARVARANAKSASAGNAGSYLSNSAAIGAGTQNAIANAKLKADIANSENRANVDRANLGIKGANNQIAFNIAQMNDANKQARSTGIVKGLEGLAGAAQLYTKNKNQDESDEDAKLLERLNRLAPNFNYKT